jgi:hypothetical protein
MNTHSRVKFELGGNGGVGRWPRSWHSRKGLGLGLGLGLLQHSKGARTAAGLHPDEAARPRRTPSEVESNAYSITAQRIKHKARPWPWSVWSVVRVVRGPHHRVIASSIIEDRSRRGSWLARMLPIGPGGPQSGFSAPRYVSRDFRQKKIGSADSPPPPGGPPVLGSLVWRAEGLPSTRNWPFR